MELVRTTEYAALACARWIGRGDKEGADGAAVDAMRLLLDTVSMDGVVVIGEGEKDEAPMLYNGEQIGDGSPPQVDIAVDPLEGTELCAKGLPNAIATIALSERGTMFDPGPCVYMLKMATSRTLAPLLDLDRPIGETLKLMAKEKDVGVGDLVVIMLDRDRHEDYMREIREVGARIRLIPHGDVSAALAAVTEDSRIDLLFGIGGTPEGVLAAAAIQCTGGPDPRSAVAALGRGAERRAGGRLRPRGGARQGPARVGQRRLLRGDRRHGRRDARRRALHRRAGRNDRVDLDALALGHRAADRRPARPREAARDHRRAAGLSALRGGAPAAASERAETRSVGQRAQEGVGHDHVDAQLGLLVDPAAERGRDRGVEVHDLGRDEQGDLAGAGRGAAGGGR